MFDDIRDRVARLSIARLQKRVDVLKAQQEALDAVTKLRTLSELEHYRFQVSIGVAVMVFFGMLVLMSIGFMVLVKLSHYTDFEKLPTALIVGMIFIIFVGIWEGTVSKADKFWQAASPINRAELQQRIAKLEAALTERMSRRFRWGVKKTDVNQQK
jgi:hypothetical protein